MYHRTILAAIDGGHYLSPGYRDKGMVGWRMWRSAKAALIEEGVRFIMAHDNAKRPLMPFFLALGFEPLSTMWIWTGDEITIETIPHEEQRYPTVGDWLFVERDLCAWVSEIGDWRNEMAVAVHELVEAILCRAAGVPGCVVDAFDKAYEHGEPGTSRATTPHAPYHRQHCFRDGG